MQNLDFQITLKGKYAEFRFSNYFKGKPVMKPDVRVNRVNLFKIVVSVLNVDFRFANPEHVVVLPGSILTSFI